MGKNNKAVMLKYLNQGGLFTVAQSGMFFLKEANCQDQSRESWKRKEQVEPRHKNDDSGKKGFYMILASFFGRWSPFSSSSVPKVSANLNFTVLLSCVTIFNFKLCIISFNLRNNFSFTSTSLHLTHILHFIKPSHCIWGWCF